MPSKTVSVKIPIKEYKALKALAATKGSMISWLLRVAVQDYLWRHTSEEGKQANG